MPPGPARILLVDDEPRYIRAIKLNLEACGYVVLTATDGQAAVALAAAEQPDLILLDVRMPELTGFEACQRIRAFSRVPILMLTALAEDADRAQGAAVGANGYITKPFHIDHLIAQVQHYLRPVG